jgi:hypothetical protein
MDIQQINRTDPESVRVAFKNVDGGGSITTGFGVAIVTTAGSFDGVSGVKHAATNTRNFFGVAQTDAPINGYGKAVVWGYAKSIAISNVGTSITVTAGDLLIPGAVSGTYFSGSTTDQALSTLLYRYFIAGTTNTISALAWVSGFVRGF